MVSPGPTNRSGGPLAVLLRSAARSFRAIDHAMAVGAKQSFWRTLDNLFSLAPAGAVWHGIERPSGGILAARLAHGVTDVGPPTWGLSYLGYLGS